MASSSAGPTRRTVHACMQCRERKQKCGGVTSQATCIACQHRKVECSFADEARDPRYNPYLRIQSIFPNVAQGQGHSHSPENGGAGPSSPRTASRGRGSHSGGGGGGRGYDGDAGNGQVHDELQRLRHENQRLKEKDRNEQYIDHRPSIHHQHYPYPQNTHHPQAISSLIHPSPPYEQMAYGQYEPSQATYSEPLTQYDLPNPTPTLPIHIPNPTNPHHSVPSSHPYQSQTIPLPPAPIPQPQASSSSSVTLPPISSPTNSTSFNGPMKVLQELGADDVFDVENHDPVTRQILTYGEASVAFRLFFSKCHLNAPFLDPRSDSDMESVRTRNIALFLNIIVVGARFWSHSSRRDSWLHPRYSQLVSLLDGEMSRLTLRPRPSDICLETIQAWMIYSHWMPVDQAPAPAPPPTHPSSSSSSSLNPSSSLHPSSSLNPSSSSHPPTSFYRSRFSESSVWQCLGLAMRWATLLGLDKIAHVPFLESGGKKAGVQDVRNYRTMLYLTESDHYLALSARRPSTLLTTPIYNVLPRFLRGEWVQATDTRLASLLRVVQAAHVMGGKAETIESLEAFNEDVNSVERNFLSVAASMDPGFDKMGQHFPFTSLRWYRLAFASTLLPPTGSWRDAGEPLRLSVDWASQILYHLSSSASMTPFHLAPGSIDTALEPDEDLVRLLSFAIDQYFVVIAYTASFLVLAWQNGAIDTHLQMQNTRQSTSTSTTTPTPHSSTLYRLVDLASRTLRQCAPARGHLASRYAEFLGGMAGMVASAIPPAENDMNGGGGTTGSYEGGVQGGSAGTGTGNGVWDQDWLNLWQNSGLEQDWLFGGLDDGVGFGGTG